MSKASCVVWALSVLVLFQPAAARQDSWNWDTSDDLEGEFEDVPPDEQSTFETVIRGKRTSGSQSSDPEWPTSLDDDPCSDGYPSLCSGATSPAWMYVYDWQEAVEFCETNQSCELKTFLLPDNPSEHSGDFDGPGARAKRVAVMEAGYTQETPVTRHAINTAPPPDGTAQATDGDPVALASGSLQLRVTDLRVPGPVRPLEFTRSYDSKSTARGTLGANWVHNWDVRLEPVHEGNDRPWLPSADHGRALLLHAGDGSTTRFVRIAGVSHYVAPTGSAATLHELHDGWELVYPDGRELRFDSLGYLVSDHDRFGNGFVVEYEDTPLYRFYKRYCTGDFAEMFPREDPRVCAVLAYVFGDGPREKWFTWGPLDDDELKTVFCNNQEDLLDLCAKRVVRDPWTGQALYELYSCPPAFFDEWTCASLGWSRYSGKLPHPRNTEQRAYRVDEGLLYHRVALPNEVAYADFYSELIEQDPDVLFEEPRLPLPYDGFFDDLRHLEHLLDAGSVGVHVADGVEIPLYSILGKDHGVYHTPENTYGDRRRRPVMVRDSLGRELRLEYVEWDDTEGVGARSVADVGLLKRIRGPEGLEVTFKYDRPDDLPRRLNASFLTEVIRHFDTSEFPPEVMLAETTDGGLLADERTVYTYNWPGYWRTPSYNQYDYALWRSFVDFKAVLTGARSYAPQASLVALQYIESIADNIVAVRRERAGRGLRVELESRYGVDPTDRASLDRVVRQRYGGRELAALESAGWETAYPEFTIEYIQPVAGEVIGEGQIDLPEGILARYALEPVPLTDRELYQVTSQALAVLIEEAEQPLPTGVGIANLNYFGHTAGDENLRVRRTAIRKSDIASAAGLSLDPSLDRFAQYFGLDAYRNRLTGDANRICSWTKTIDQRGLPWGLRYRGFNYRGQLLVDAIPDVNGPGGKQSGWIFTELVYGPDGELRRASYPNTSTEQWSREQGGVEHEYCGGTSLASEAWRSKNNLLRSVEHPRGGTVEHWRTGEGTIVAQGRVDRYEYEPVYNQMTRHSRGYLDPSMSEIIACERLWDFGSDCLPMATLCDHHPLLCADTDLTDQLLAEQRQTIAIDCLLDPDCLVYDRIRSLLDIVQPLGDTSPELREPADQVTEAALVVSMAAGAIEASADAETFVRWTASAIDPEAASPSVLRGRVAAEAAAQGIAGVVDTLAPRSPNPKEMQGIASSLRSWRTRDGVPALLHLAGTAEDAVRRLLRTAPLGHQDDIRQALAIYRDPARSGDFSFIAPLRAQIDTTLRPPGPRAVSARSGASLQGIIGSLRARATRQQHAALDRAQEIAARQPRSTAERVRLVESAAVLLRPIVVAQRDELARNVIKRKDDAVGRLRSKIAKLTMQLNCTEVELNPCARRRPLREIRHDPNDAATARILDFQWAPHGLPARIEEVGGRTLTLDYYDSGYNDAFAWSYVYDDIGPFASPDMHCALTPGCSSVEGPDSRGFLAETTRSRFDTEYGSIMPDGELCTGLAAPYGWVIGDCDDPADLLSGLGLSEEAVAQMVLGPDEDPRGLHTKRYVFNALGYLRAVESDGLPTFIRRDPDGRPVRIEAPNGTITLVRYTESGYPGDIATFDGTWQQDMLSRTRRIYDDAGAVLRECRELEPGGCAGFESFPLDSYVHTDIGLNPDYQLSVAEYGPGGRLRTLRNAVGVRTDFLYNARGLVTLMSQVDELGGGNRTVRYDHDQDGNIITRRFGAQGDLASESSFFDGLRRLRTRIDPRGLSCDVSYTPLDQPSRRFCHGDDGGATDELIMAYDVFGQVTEVIRNGSEVTQIAYGPWGRSMRSSTSGQSPSWTIFDGDGRTVWSADSQRNQLIATYDPLARVVTTSSVRSAKGIARTISEISHLDENHLPTAITRLGRTEAGDELSTSAEFERGPTGLVRRIALADGAEVLFGRNWAGWPVWTQAKGDDQAMTSWTKYDPSGRVVHVESPNGDRTLYNFDAFGQKRSVVYPGPDDPVLRWEYDELGRVTKYITPTNDTIDYEYDGRGDLVRLRWRRKTLAEWAYDELGRVVRQADYNVLLGRADGAVVEFLEYDGLDRPLRQEIHTGGVEQEVASSWESLEGSVRRHVELPTGASQIRVYDSLGRLESVNAGSRRWTMRWLGGMLTGHDMDWDPGADPARERLTLDPLGRSVRRTTTFVDLVAGSPANPGWAQEYLAGQNPPGGGDIEPAAQLISHRDTLGRRISGKWLLGFPVVGLGIAGEPPNPWRGFDFDGFGRLENVWSEPGAGAGVDVTTLGNGQATAADVQALASMTGADETSLGRSAMGELESVTLNGSLRWQMLAAREEGSQLPDLKVDSTSIAVVHDATGRVTRQGPWTFQYGPRGRLVAVSRGGAIVESYGYTADGRLASVWSPNGLAESFAYDGVHMVTSLDANGERLWEATWGARRGQLLGWRVPSTDELLYPILDERRAVVATWSTEQRRITALLDLGPYGRLRVLAPNGAVKCEDAPDGTPCTTPSGLPFVQGGMWRSERTGLTCMGSRWYSAVLKQFVSRDPLDYVDCFNPYAYAADDPINRWDPTGTESQSLTDGTLYVPPGYAYTQHLAAVREIQNGDNPWYFRAGMFTLAMALGPLAGFEEYGVRSLLNVPYVMHNAGIAIGWHSSDMVDAVEEGRPDDAVVEGLHVVEQSAFGFLVGTSTLSPITTAGRPRVPPVPPGSGGAGLVSRARMSFDKWVRRQEDAIIDRRQQLAAKLPEGDPSKHVRLPPNGQHQPGRSMLPVRGPGTNFGAMRVELADGTVVLDKVYRNTGKMHNEMLGIAELQQSGVDLSQVRNVWVYTERATCVNCARGILELESALPAKANVRVSDSYGRLSWPEVGAAAGP